MLKLRQFVRNFGMERPLANQTGFLLLNLLHRLVVQGKLDRVQNAHIACHRTGICIRICIGNVSNASGACHQNSVVAANILPIHYQPAHKSKNYFLFFGTKIPNIIMPRYSIFNHMLLNDIVRFVAQSRCG